MSSRFRDSAALAGLSPTIASAALRGDRWRPASTQRRVERMARNPGNQRGGTLSELMAKLRTVRAQLARGAFGSAVVMFFLLCGTAALASAAGAARPASDPALASIVDEPGLPRVLLIGDSISIGYTLPARDLLRGKANVHRVPGNASSSGHGLALLDRWLGDGRWDVIHFNFGIHDAKLPPEGNRHASVELYARNLRQIVARLKRTGARLIWASSTPIPLGGNLSPVRRFADINAYNEAAKAVMLDQGVVIDDLNAAIAPQAADLWVPGDLHFRPAGYALLARQVAMAVSAALPPP